MALQLVVLVCPLSISFYTPNRRHKCSTNIDAGNTLGAATNTVGKGVQGVTDTAGNVVAAGGKGLGDAVTGITQGAGDTTKGMSSLQRGPA